jgi:hypothetical protein
MNFAFRLAELRSRIVQRLEAENEAADYPEWWRIKDGRVERGFERHWNRDPLGVCRCESYRVWVPVPFLSSELLRRLHEHREAQAADIPF